MGENETWWPFVNEILYSVQFHEELTVESAAWLAQRVVGSTRSRPGPEEYYAAFVEAVERGEGLTELIPESHSEQDFRVFLAEVVAQLDALRPWPEPPYRQLDISRWEDFEDPVVIARLAAGLMVAQGMAGAVFETLEDIQKSALIMRLKSGSVVALVDEWWDDSWDIALVSQGPCGDPAGVVREIVAATKFAEEDFELVGG